MSVVGKPASHQKALDRERSLAKLRELVLTDVEASHAAMRVVAAAVIKYQDDTARKYSRIHVCRRRLLEVAKRIACKPASMMEFVSDRFSSNRPPSEYERIVLVNSGYRVRRWQLETFRAAGEFDHGVASEVGDLKRTLDGARTNGFGLQGRNACDAYAFEFTRGGPVGSFDDMAASIRGMPSEFPSGTPVVPLSEMITDITIGDADRPRTRDEWMQAALVILLALDPEFDGREVGCDQPLHWRIEGGDIFSGRRRIAEHAELRDHEFYQHASLAIDRATIGIDRVGRKRSEGGRRPGGVPTLGLRARRTLVLLQERAAHEPITGPLLVERFMKRWPDEDSLTEETLRGSVIPEIREATPVDVQHKKGYSLPEDSPARRWVFSGD